MDTELQIPTEVPVMTLADCVFFPHSVLPLHIFEPRYREMLQDVLQSERVFAVCKLDERAARQTDQFEPPAKVGTIGLVRVCHRNSDGTSNLILQGLSRVRVDRIVRETPYRLIAITPLANEPLAADSDLRKLQSEVTRLLADRQRLHQEIPAQFLEFLCSIEDPEVFLDITAFSVCPSAKVKQGLLEKLDPVRRYRALSRWLKSGNRRMRLLRRLQGRLRDEDIPLN